MVPPGAPSPAVVSVKPSERHYPQPFTRAARVKVRGVGKLRPMNDWVVEHFLSVTTTPPRLLSSRPTPEPQRGLRAKNTQTHTRKKCHRNEEL